MSGRNLPTTGGSRPPVYINLEAEFARTGLTNDEVARRLEVPERAVRRWRKGDIVPSWPNLTALAEVFDRTPDWFYADHDDQPAAA